MLQWRQPASPDGLSSRIPAIIFQEDETLFGAAVDTWATLFQHYTQFDVNAYYTETNTAASANAVFIGATAEAQYYYSVLLDGTIDELAPVPLFGKFQNNYSLVHALFHSCAKTNGVDANKVRQLRLSFYDHVFCVCLQYYALVRKRFLVLDTSSTQSTFADSHSPFMLMMFLHYEVTGATIAHQYDVSTMHGCQELALAVGLIPFVLTVLRAINTHLGGTDDPLFTRDDPVELSLADDDDGGEEEEGDEPRPKTKKARSRSKKAAVASADGFTNLWNTLVQTRFRECPIHDYVVQVYKATPHAHKAHANESEIEAQTSLITFAPKVIYRGIKNVKNVFYNQNIGRSRSSFPIQRQRIVSMFVHHYFTPLHPVFELSAQHDADARNWYDGNCKEPLMAIDMKYYMDRVDALKFDVNRLCTFIHHVKNLQDVLAWQLDRFMKLSYSPTFTTALSTQFRAMVHTLQYHGASQSTLNKRGFSLPRISPWKNLDAANSITLSPERLRASVTRPQPDNDAKTSLLFHPQREGSLYATLPSHEANAPMTSPAAISLHAFMWMINTAPRDHTSPTYRGNRLTIPNVLTFEPDTDHVSIEAHHISNESNVVQFRNYRWHLPMPSSSPSQYYLVIKHLYRFFYSWGVDEPLESKPMYEVYLAMLLLLGDERKAVSMIWTIYRQAYDSNKHQVWKVFRINYLVHRREAFDMYNQLKREIPSLNMFMDKLKETWDGSAPLQPTRAHLDVLLTGPVVLSSTDVNARAHAKFHFEEHQKPGHPRLIEPPIYQCRQAYLNHAKLQPDLERSYSMFIVDNGTGKSAPLKCEEVVYQAMAYTVEDDIIDVARFISNALFPTDPVRYGPSGSLTWRQFKQPRDETYPMLAELVDSVYTQIESNSALREEIRHIGAREVRRKRKELSVDEERDEPTIQFSRAEHVGELVYKLLRDKVNAHQNTDYRFQDQILNLGAVYSTLQGVYESTSRQPPHVEREVNDCCHRFVCQIACDLDDYALVRMSTLEHYKHALTCLLGSTHEATRKLLETMASDQLAQVLNPVTKLYFRDWIAGKSKENVDPEGERGGGSGMVKKLKVSLLVQGDKIALKPLLTGRVQLQLMPAIPPLPPPQQRLST
jgi:hypothetical protein